MSTAGNRVRQPDPLGRERTCPVRQLLRLDVLTGPKSPWCTARANEAADNRPVGDQPGRVRRVLSNRWTVANGGHRRDERDPLPAIISTMYGVRGDGFDAAGGCSGSVAVPNDVRERPAGCSTTSSATSRPASGRVGSAATTLGTPAPTSPSPSWRPASATTATRRTSAPRPELAQPVPVRSKYLQPRNTTRRSGLQPHPAERVREATPASTPGGAFNYRGLFDAMAATRPWTSRLDSSSPT